jgi:hypothetical protein
MMAERVVLDITTSDGTRTVEVRAETRDEVCLVMIVNPYKSYEVLTNLSVKIL